MVEKYPDLVATSDPYTGYRDSPSQTKTLHLQKDKTFKSKISYKYYNLLQIAESDGLISALSTGLPR